MATKVQNDPFILLLSSGNKFLLSSLFAKLFIYLTMYLIRRRHVKMILNVAFVFVPDLLWQQLFSYTPVKVIININDKYLFQLNQ